MDCHCFYVLPDGKVFNNPKVWPVDLLSEMHDVPPRDIFRFAFGPAENKVYVQDQSFRGLLVHGAERAWNFFNQALRAIESKFNARAPKLAFGDPPESAIDRTLAEYKHANLRLRKFFKEDVGIEIPDIKVQEIPGPSESADRGLLVIGRTLFNEDDPNYVTINKMVEIGFLRNVDKIFEGHPEIEKKLMVFRQGRPEKAYFAVIEKDKVRVFKAKMKEDGNLPLEKDIREAVPGYEGPIATFTFDSSPPLINFRNEIPSYLRSFKEGKDFVDQIIQKMSKANGIPSESVTVTFDPSLGRPFVTRLSRYGFFQFIPKDIRVLETPFTNEISMVIRDPDEEEAKAPGLKMNRAIHGIEIEYPFIALNDYLTSRGLALRSLAHSAHEIFPDQNILPTDKEYISFLMLRGMPKEEILDLVAGRDDLVSRNRVSKTIESSLEKEAFSKKRTVTAGWGKGLGINDWWSLNVPQALNAISLNPKPKPFNLKKKKKEPVTYEGLLSKEHDEQLPERIIDVQLRQSQI